MNPIVSPGKQCIRDDRFVYVVERYRELISHDTQIRHRLMGADNWGVVAEIWRHTNPSLPSEEDDIVRVQDDYGR